jgi:hypothetical protein
MIKKFISLLALVSAGALTAHAQFIPEAQPFQLFNVSTVIYVPGITTTSFPTTLAVAVPVGKNGTGFYFKMGATNAASTTNATVILEQVATDSLDGTENIIDSGTFTVSVPQNGTTKYDYFTNIVATTANYGNFPRFRIRSIQNTNVLGIFITNCVAYVRE